MDMTRLGTLVFALLSSCISAQACLSGEPKVDMCVSNSQTVAGGVYVDTSLFTGSQCDCQFITRNASSLIVEMTKAPFLPTCGTDISITYGGETVNKTCGSISENIFPVTDNTGAITISKVGKTISREDLCVFLEPVGDAEISVVCSDSTDYLSTTIENFRTSISELQTSPVPYTTAASNTPTIIPIDLTTSSLDMSSPLKDIVTDGFPRETVTDKLSEPTPYIETTNTKISNKTLTEEIDPYSIEPPDDIKNLILKKAKNSKNPVFIETLLSTPQKTTVAARMIPTISGDPGSTSRGPDLISNTSKSPFTATSEPRQDIKNKILIAANNSNNPILIESMLSATSTRDFSTHTEKASTSEIGTTLAMETTTDVPSEPPTSIRKFILARANDTDNPITFETLINNDYMNHTTTPSTVSTDSESTTSSTDMTSTIHHINSTQTDGASTSEVRTTLATETTTAIPSVPPTSIKKLILARANDTDNPIRFETSINNDSIKHATTPSTVGTDSESTTSSTDLTSTIDHINSTQTDGASTSEVRTTLEIETTTAIPSEPPTSIKELILARANDTDNPIRFETSINNDSIKHTTTPSTVGTDSEPTTSSTELTSTIHDISSTQTGGASTSEVTTTLEMETTTDMPSEPPTSIKEFILARANDTDKPIRFETSINNDSIKHATTPSTVGTDSEPTTSSTNMTSTTHDISSTQTNGASTSEVTTTLAMETTTRLPSEPPTSIKELILARANDTDNPISFEPSTNNDSMENTPSTVSIDSKNTHRPTESSNDSKTTIKPTTFSEKQSTTIIDRESEILKTTTTLPTSTATTSTETVYRTTDSAVIENLSTRSSLTSTVGTVNKDIFSTIEMEPTTSDYQSTFSPASTSLVSESATTIETTTVTERSSSTLSSTTKSLSKTDDVSMTSKKSTMSLSTTPIVVTTETSTLTPDVHSTTELFIQSSTPAQTSSGLTTKPTEVPHSTTTEPKEGLITDNTRSSTTQEVYKTSARYTQSTENIQTTTKMYETPITESKTPPPPPPPPPSSSSTTTTTTTSSPVATTTTLSRIMDSTTDAFFKWAFGNSDITDESSGNEQTTTASKSTTEKAEPTTEKTEAPPSSSSTTTTEKSTTPTADETTPLHIMSTSKVIELLSDSTTLSHTTDISDVQAEETIDKTTKINLNANIVITDKPKIRSTTSKTTIVDKGIKGTRNETEEDNPLLGQDTLVVILVGVIIGIIVVIAIIAMLTSFVKSRRRSANITVMEKGNMELYGSGIDNPLVQLQQQDQMVEINPDPEPSLSARDIETSNGNIGTTPTDEVIHLNEMDNNGISSHNNALANGNSSKLGDVKSENTNSSL